MSEFKVSRSVSNSVRVVLEQLSRLGMTKTEFARRLGVSQDYVYRILNGRGGFPRSRETLERIAGVCELDPFVFAEYRERTEALSTSARLVWDRMRELGMSRDELFKEMGGRISRPYFNSIMRGDQPFPTNRAYIQLFSLALQLPPSAFPEFGWGSAPRWQPEEVGELEVRCYHLFFDKMMADYGFSRRPLSFEFLEVEKVLSFFMARDEFPDHLVRVLDRMGELGMGFRELEKICGVPRERLSRLFGEREFADGAVDDVEAIRAALRMIEDPS